MLNNLQSWNRFWAELNGQGISWWRERYLTFMANMCCPWDSMGLLPWCGLSKESLFQMEATYFQWKIPAWHFRMINQSDACWWVNQSIDELIDELIDWLIDWLIGWLVGWLTDWLSDWLVHSLIDLLTDWLTWLDFIWFHSLVSIHQLPDHPSWSCLWDHVINRQHGLQR